MPTNNSEPPIATVTKSFTVTRSSHGRRRVRPGSPPPPPPIGRLPRVTKLLALAIHFDELLRTGAVTSQAELARLSRVSRPRLTQIMGLLYLCPSIQAEILAHPSITSGRDPITERELRSIVGKPDWTRQRRLFDRLVRSNSD